MLLYSVRPVAASLNCSTKSANCCASDITACALKKRVWPGFAATSYATGKTPVCHDRRDARLPCRLVIWRAGGNLADATLSANPRVCQSASRTGSSCGEPGLHVDRDRDRGFHSVAPAH